MCLAGWDLDTALFPGGEHVLQEQTDSRQDQGVGLSAVCGDHVDSAGSAPAASSSQSGDSHQRRHTLTQPRAGEYECTHVPTLTRWSLSQAVLVESPLDLTLYHSVLQYWRSCCLPPTGSGVLSVLGLVQVQDLAYYLQYYSLPVITAILTPVIKLIMSLKRVYSC